MPPEVHLYVNVHPNLLDSVGVLSNCSILRVPQVAGIHRALPSKANSSGMFRTLVLGNYLRPLTKHLGSSEVTEDDIEHIKGIAKRADCLDLLSEVHTPRSPRHKTASQKPRLDMSSVGAQQPPVNTLPVLTFSLLSDTCS